MSKYCIVFQLISGFVLGTVPTYAQTKSVERLIEPLRFGMEVGEFQGRVRVVEFGAGRPIALKLQVEDILRSYREVGARGAPQPIQVERDLGPLKKLLAAGKRVELEIYRLRKAGNSVGAYYEETVILDRSDLATETVVVEQTRSYGAVPYTEGGVTVEEETGIVRVPVYYATDRLLENRQYGGARDPGLEPNKFGVCEVTLPPDHRTGRLEGPKWWKFELSENPLKHVVLATVTQLGKQQVRESMQRQYDLQDADRKRLLVFVHGYNVSFENAAKRAAQLHYDLGFPGLTAFYSWPSNGKPQDYLSDGGDIEWSIPNITAFLREVSAWPIDDIYIIAHSMGNRGVTKALLDLAGSGKAGKVREIILAAADVDAQVFDRDVAPELSSVFQRVTVYASSRDKALWCSAALSETPRVGEIRDSEPTIQSRTRFEIIDASQVETDFTAHSYFGDDSSIIADIFHVIRNNLPPDARHGLRKKSGRLGEFWVVP